MIDSPATEPHVPELHLELNRPALMLELVRFLRAFGYSIEEVGYSTVRVKVDDHDVRSKLAARVQIWASVAAAGAAGTEVRLLPALQASLFPRSMGAPLTD